jgi:uncharacterized protein YndB with AHSA1/START domain
MATRQQPQATVTLRLERHFAASPARVFRAWTAPAEMKQWKAPGEMSTPVAEVDLRPGGAYRIDMQGPDGTLHRLVGVYQVVDPPNKLVYTWRWEDDPGGSETLVTVEFLDNGGATDLVLVHERFPTEDDLKRHEHGWTGCFDKLARVVASR